jgi:hypothetical protein
MFVTADTRRSLQTDAMPQYCFAVSFILLLQLTNAAFPKLVWSSNSLQFTKYFRNT